MVTDRFFKMFLKVNQYLRQQKVVSVYAKPLGRKNGEEGAKYRATSVVLSSTRNEKKREKEKKI